MPSLPSIPLFLWEIVFNYEAAKECRTCQRKRARSTPSQAQLERHSRFHFLRTTRALMNGTFQTETATELAARQHEKERAVEGRAADGLQDGRTAETAAAAAMIQVGIAPHNNGQSHRADNSFSSRETIVDTEKGDN